MALTTVARYTLRDRLAGNFGLRGVVTGTATDGSSAVQASNALVDARDGLGLQDTAYGAERFDGAWLELWGRTTGTTLEWARVPNAGYSPSEGKITVGRAFAATPVSGTAPYALHTHGLAPDELNDALRWAAQNAIRDVQWTLAGLVTDGNMEDSGVTNWTGTNATAAKTTTEAQVGRGEQGLSVTNSGAGGYAQSASIPVREGRQYRVHALVRPTTGVATLVPRDLTNGADISVSWALTSSFDAADGSDWRFLTGTFEAPAGCVSLALRLTNSSASGVTYWDDVCLYAVDDLHVDLPSWLADPLQDTIDVYTAAYSFHSREAYRLEKMRPLRRPVGSPTAATAWRLPVPAAALSRPIVLHAARAFPDLSSETSTVPEWAQHWILAGALYRCYELGARPRGLDGREFAAERERAYGEWLRWCTTNHPAYRHGRPVWSD